MFACLVFVNAFACVAICRLETHLIQCRSDIKTFNKNHEKIILKNSLICNPMDMI